jgi:NAD(P)-dependent dehydrogenase (short-subunit alcohol dehydrogenase family)
MGRLERKRAVVTGAGSGIGRATALLFAEEGASVVAADRDGTGLDETVRRIEGAGGRAIGQVADAGRDDAVRALVETSLSELGGIDAFFANAGISGGALPFWEIREQDFLEVLRVNLLGPFFAIQHASRAMQQNPGGGSIICTASVAALRSGAGSTSYSASKAGVVSLVQTTANQLAGTGVRVNAVCPGLIETGMTRPMFDLARARGTDHKIGQLNPTRRAGQPVEIAQVVAFLASDAAAYVNGQAIAVDGGLSSTHPFVPGRLA